MTNDGTLKKHAGAMFIGSLAGMILANQIVENNDMDSEKQGLAAGALIMGGAVVGAMLGYWNDRTIYNNAYEQVLGDESRNNDDNYMYSRVLGAMAGAQAVKDFFPATKILEAIAENTMTSYSMIDIDSVKNLSKVDALKAALTGFAVFTGAVLGDMKARYTALDGMEHANRIASQRENEPTQHAR